MKGSLRRCPKCLQSWPDKVDYDLRGFGWLAGLPRHITTSNADALIHDGGQGRDRFLLLEVKMPWEPALQYGQALLLTSLARQNGWTVRLLHSLKGEQGTLRYHRVTGNGVSARGIIVPRSSFRDYVGAWLGGLPWDDPRGEEEHEPEKPQHVCGWAQVDGLWRCIQDHYAVGFKPETACGKTWEPAV